MAQGVSTSRKITDEQVKADTGKSWAEWVLVLDAWEGTPKSFASLSNFLTGKHKLTQTWAQVIAVYYRWKGYKSP